MALCHHSCNDCTSPAKELSVCSPRGNHIVTKFTSLPACSASFACLEPAQHRGALIIKHFLSACRLHRDL